MAGFRLAEPAWLLAAGLGPLLFALRIALERRAPSLVYPGASKLSGIPPGVRSRLRHLPLLLACLGLVLAAIAQARPQQGSSREHVTAQGIDIVVALDVSGSMAAEDFQPKNRISVAKDVVAEFIRGRKNDRVGLVIFASKSLTKCPPTTDTSVLLRQLDDVNLDSLPDGTAIGSGLSTALSRLRRSKAKSRVIVLVTDGGNNAGEIDPMTAADMAKAMEVRVYTIAVGRGGEVPMPVKVQDPFTGAIVTRTVNVEVDVDEELLKKIAERTGADFFRATDQASMRQIFERIDHLETSEIRLTAFKRYRELYAEVLVGSAALFLASGLLWAGGLRVCPS